MLRGGLLSWNLRDRHMAGTLETIIAHLDRRGVGDKVVVWQRDSHIGDARATQMGDDGEVNVGQLVRERYRAGTPLVGFSTYASSVTAASVRGTPAERKRVRQALLNSYEALFHATGLANFMLNLRGDLRAREALHERRLERAIGVVYMASTERLSHYFYAQITDQFDALLHFDNTRAVIPLERTSTWEQGEEPETYPFAV